MNNLEIPRVLISATGSGKGKTTITALVLKALQAKNMDVHGFKCGPDYIDPMYHEAVIGIESKNIDPFFCDENLMKASFLEGAGEINVIEGCMGLYDGMGVSQISSPYTVARNLSCPVILVVDAYGRGYSILAEIKGFLSLDENKLIRGIILNRISPNYYLRLKPVIEDETGIGVVGFLPKLSEELFESRHLGLKSVTENHAVEKIDRLYKNHGENIDIDQILEIARGADKISESASMDDYIGAEVKECLNKKKIAIAKDEAFNFYYKDNILALTKAGAEVVFFSPINDKSLPKNIDAIYLGGGYPELYINELSANDKIIRELREFVDNGGKVFAECGGFLYLCKTVDDISMVHIFDENASNKNKLVRFGYVNAEYDKNIIKGHEFHHYDVDNPGTEFTCTKVSTDEKYYAGIREKNCLASFLHLYFMSNPKILISLFG